MLTTTKEVRRRKRRFRHDPEALVIITRSEYNSLRQTSLVDCGMPIYVPKADVIEEIRKHEVQPLAPLPDHLVERLRNAVSCSKRLSSNQKRLVLGEEESSKSHSEEDENKSGEIT